MTNFINANGFLTSENPSNDLPNSEQVEFCVKKNETYAQAIQRTIELIENQ